MKETLHYYFTFSTWLTFLSNLFTVRVHPGKGNKRKNNKDIFSYISISFSEFCSQKDYVKALSKKWNLTVIPTQKLKVSLSYKNKMSNIKATYNERSKSIRIVPKCS